MLPKKERLTKKDFIGLRPRIIFRGSFVDIAYVKSESTRFACVIAKKRLKKAVDRNKVKRRVYEIVKKIKPSSPSLIIIYPKTSALTTKITSIQEEITQAFATL